MLNFLNKLTHMDFKTMKQICVIDNVKIVIESEQLKQSKVIYFIIEFYS
jgi:hypothetical protein